MLFRSVIRDIKKKIALLFDWIAEAKAELAKPQAPNLVSLLNAYYTQRKAGAYSQKGKISNLKEMNETFNYLRANDIYSLEDLEHRVSEHSAATESLKKTPVSYTHLDVYKRQNMSTILWFTALFYLAIRLKDWNRPKRNMPPPRFRRAVFLPVSYTHLDVYKRQVTATSGPLSL